MKATQSTKMACNNGYDGDWMKQHLGKQPPSCKWMISGELIKIELIDFKYDSGLRRI
jgi:hypothetical protein